MQCVVIRSFGRAGAARQDYRILSTTMWNAYLESLISDIGLPVEANFYNQDIYILPRLSR